MPRRPVPWFYGLTLLAVLVVRAHSFHYVVDDAYISFRYAQNLVRHGELCFNPGERVEGVTNLLWTVWLAIPEALHLAPETFAQVSGLVCGALALWLTLGWAVQRGRLQLAEAWLAALALAVLAPLPLWAQSGMETAPFTLLFVATFVLAERLDRGRMAAPALGLVATLAFAVRPEGALGMLLGCAAAGGWRRRRRRLALAAAIFALGVLAITLFRWWYFGSPVPNTFAAKRTFVTLLLRNGADYALGFSWHYLLLPLAALLAAALARGQLRVLAARLGRHPLLLAAAAFLAYVVQAGGDWMPYARFLVPILPLLVIGLAEVAAALGIDLARPRDRTIALVVIGGMLLLESRGVDRERLRYNRDKLQPRLELVAQALQEQGTHPTIALSVAGLVPYRTQLPTIDLLGLSDVRIAHAPPAPYRSLPGHHKIDPGYVLDERKPDLIFLNMGACVSDQPLPELEPWDLEKFLYVHPSFQRDYELSFLSVRGRFVNAYQRRSHAR